MIESSEMQTQPLNPSLPRRYEIDALRSIALLLLIVYHVFCAFQPLATSLQLIGYSDTLESVWLLGELLNTWRIPVLFLIAGITTGYLLCNRSVGNLLQSRLMRLVPPLLVTSFFVAPISSLFFQLFQGDAVRYMPSPGHLWFVWNLVVYFVLAVPLLFYLKLRPDNPLLRLFSALSPYGWLLLLPGGLVLITVFLEPYITPELFSAHFLRFWYGFACFVFGVLLVSLGERFWQGIRRVCHVALPAALALYLLRMSGVDFGGALVRLIAGAFESAYGMLAFLGYGSLLFSRRSRIFPVLNRSVFAIYILHLPIQQGIAFFLFPVGLPAWVAFALHLAATLAISVLLYAIVLRWARWLYLFLGIPPLKSQASRDVRVSEPRAIERGWAVTAGRFAVLYVVSPVIVLVTMFVLVSAAIHHSRVSQAAHHPGSSSRPALRDAMFLGDLGQIREALAKGEDINRRDENGWTTFSMAVFARNPQAMEIMLEHAPDLSIRSRDGHSLLWAACWMSHYDCARMLVNHGAADSLTPSDRIALHHALQQPYEAAAAQIRLHLDVPSEADYLENRARIREMLEHHGLTARER